MNTRLERLQPYPFEKLRALLAEVEPNQQLSNIRLSIGEPQHSAPATVLKALDEDIAHGVSKYPPTAGTGQIKTAIAQWLATRFSLKHIDANRHILPVNGTREALFAIAQALVNGQGGEPRILIPNPFYQIYEGAAILAGATPEFFNLNPKTNQPDFEQIPESSWQACELMYICTPGNPTGQSLNIETMKQLILKAQKYNFALVSDECYSELYLDERQPCAGLLQACEEMGENTYKQCLVFHSLSKRSNLPGLRSGFVAGDESLISQFLLYRTYHGSAMPLHHQSASVAAWNDEQHVAENRALYRAKYEAVAPILAQEFDFIMPDSGFYLWLKTPVDDQIFTRDLYEKMNVQVVPGSFLARDTQNGNPGKNRIRLALVGHIEHCIEAAKRMCQLASEYTRTPLNES